MLRALRTVLEHRHSQGWSVGGTVRDRLMGRVSPDHDVVVADDPAEVARELAAVLDSPWFPLSTRHGAYRVLGHDSQVDVSAMRGGGILDDLLQRDFTINAMALPLGGDDDDVIDPFGGRQHLDERLLVAVSPGIFQDDPLRLMRAVRLCSVLGLNMVPALEAAVREESSAVVRAASERIMAELALMLQPGMASQAVAMLESSGLLEAVLPEAVPSGSGMSEIVTIGLSTPDRAVDTVREVALGRLFEVLDDEMAGRMWQGGPLRQEMEARMGAPVDGVFDRPAAVFLAALMRRVEPVAVAKVARRLKLSGEMSSLLHIVSAWFERATEAGLGSGPALEAAAGTGRATTLFLWQTEPWEPEVALIASADWVARGETVGGPSVADLDAAVSVLLERWVQRSTASVAPPFDGRVLMEALGLEEGPALGAVLRETRLAWEAGEVRDLEGALAVAEAARSGLSRYRSASRPDPLPPIADR